MSPSRAVAVLLFPLVACGGDQSDERLDKLADDVKTLRQELDDANDRLDTLDEESARIILRSTTLDVSTPAELDEALDWLDGRLIAHNVTVTIALADGIYEMEHVLRVDHPDGARIHVIGNEDTPAAVLLNFGQDEDGVEVRDGRALAELNGVTLQGPGAASGSGGHGIYVRRNAYLSLGSATDGGPGVVVIGFGGDGMRAEDGGVLVARGVTVSDNGGSGVRAMDGSYLEASGAVSTGNIDVGMRASNGATLVASGSETSTNGTGYQADGAANLIATSAWADDNTKNGFRAARGSNLVVTADEDEYPDHAPKTNNNGGNGVLAEQGSFVAFTDGAATDNGGGGGGDGVLAELGSFIFAEGTSATNNQGWGFEAQTSSSIRMTSAEDVSGNGEGKAEPRGTDDDTKGTTISY